MEIRLDGNPDFGEATCTLDPGEVLVCEGGAMSRMSAGMDLNTRAAGGVLKSLLRGVGAGESFLLSEYSSGEGGFVTVAPVTPGAIVHRKMEGELLRLSAGSYLASSAGISLETRFGEDFFRALIAGARRLGARATTRPTLGLGLDIDTETDWDDWGWIADRDTWIRHQTAPERDGF